MKGASIVGVFWGAFTAREPDAYAENMRELLGWYAAGKLRPHISKTFPLGQGREAIQWLASRKATGKVVLTV